MIDQTRQWYEDANMAISDLKECRTELKASFPQEEYLKPMEKQQKAWRAKLADFFKKDITKLMPLAGLEDLLERASRNRAVEDSSQKRVIEEHVLRARDLRKQLKKNLSQNGFTYVAAKYYFAEICSAGVYFPEAAHIRDLVWLNSSLEKKLCETLDKDALGKIQTMIQMDKNMVDPEIANRIIELIKEFERLETVTRDLLSRSRIGFPEIAYFEKIDTALRKTKLVLSCDKQFREVHKSICYLVQILLDKGYRGADLEELIPQVEQDLETGLPANYKEIIDLLAPVEAISESVSPIKEFIQFAKVMLWRARVKVAFAEGEVDVNCLDEFLSRIPPGGEKNPEVLEEVKIINKVVSLTKEWRKKCLDYLAHVENLFNLTNSAQIPAKTKALKSMLNYLLKVYAEEELQMIKNATYLFEQVKATEGVLSAVSQIGMMLGEEQITIEQFMAATELVENKLKDDKKFSNLVQQFSKVQAEVQPHLAPLNKLLAALDRPTKEDFGRMSFKMVMHRQKDKLKIFDIDCHIQKLSTKLALGKIGEKIKKHTEDFIDWEKRVKMMIESHPVRKLQKMATHEFMNLLIASTEDLKKNILASEIHSEIIDQLISYSWCLGVLNRAFNKSADIEEFKSLLSADVPPSEDVRYLQELIKKQVSIAKSLINFNNKYSTKMYYPSSRTIKKIKIIYKDCRINIDSKIKFVKECLHMYSQLKKEVKAFQSTTRPTFEKVEDLIHLLKNQKIQFKSEVESLENKVAQMRSLIKMAKKDQNPELLLKTYKSLNICSPEFERIIRDKTQITGKEQDFQSALEADLTIPEIDDILVKLLALEDSPLVVRLRQKAVLKKIELVDNAVEKHVTLLIKPNELKEIAADSRFIVSDEDDIVKKKNFIKDLSERLQHRLRKMRDMTKDGLSKLKAVMFNVVDMNSHILALMEKAEDEPRPAEKVKSKSVKLLKRKPEAEKEREKENSRRRLKNMEEEKRKQKEKLLQAQEAFAAPKKKDHLEQLKTAINNKSAASKPLPKPAVPSKPQTEKSSFVLEFSTYQEKEKENIKTLDNQQKPVNSTGIWGIFEGNCKEEASGRVVDAISLVTFESWNKIITFPKLPLGLSFKERMAEEALDEKIKALESAQQSDSSLKVLGGLVKSEGLSRICFKEIFDSKSKQFFVADYSRATTLIIVPVKDFHKRWLSIFDKSDRITAADSDFFFLVFCEDPAPQMQINPFKVMRIENKENSSFAFETFKDLERQIQKEKKKRGDLHASRAKKPINQVLGENSIAVNNKESQKASEES